MKRIPFFLCSFSISFAAHADSPKTSGDSPPGVLSLNAVTAAVLANNPSIQEARAQWEALKERVPQAAAWDDLKIGTSTQLGRFVEVATDSFTDQTLSVEQLIPLSGKNQSRARIAMAEALGSLEALRRQELEVVAQARAAYFRLANDYALLELNRANDASLAQTVEISRARLAVGNQGQADVLTAEGELAQIAETRRDLELAASDDATQLQVLMNRDPFSPLGQPVEANVHFALPSVERLRSLLFSHRPEVRMAEAGVAAAKAKLELAKRAWIPDPALSVEAQRYNGASQAASEVGVGISFNVPWLNGQKYRAGEREAQSGVAAAQRALDRARTEALGKLRDQLQKIESSHHHDELFASRLVPLSQQTVQTNRTNYESGKTGFLDLVLSERSLRELEAMARAHRADYEIAVAELEAVVGTDLNLFTSHHESPSQK